jgi:hypothetical protein
LIYMFIFHKHFMHDIYLWLLSWSGL